MIGYKLFRTVKGELRPLYVYADKTIPIGEWLEAEPGPMKDGKVVSRLGLLAYRPGWHISTVPYVEHIYTVHEGIRCQKKGTVWCEVEYHDFSYQSIADEHGIHNDKFVARDACLKHVPKGGYYMYKTSPAMFGEWAIAGEMKVLKVLTDEEVDEICTYHGIKSQPRIETE